MMSGGSALLVLHILLVVAWLGIDVGVFTSSFVMRRPGMSAEARTAVRGLMLSLDLAPRVSLILMIPVALGLSRVTGWGLAGVPAPLFWSVGLLGAAWAGFSVVSVRRSGLAAPSWVAAFSVADRALRAVASVFFLVTGVWSLVGPGPWNGVWVAWKAALFGVIIALGLWIRRAAGRYRPALSELLEKGESPERLAAVNRRIRGVYPPVLAVWVLLVVMVILAVARP